MSLIARFEEIAENLFTGMFRKKVTRLQPVLIAKELVKVMLRHKQVSISQVYVPNIYRVFLHSSDWSPLASFGDAFLIELSKYLFAEGERNGFTFLTKPAVELHADDTVNPREMFIEVDFDDSVEIAWEEDDDDESQVWHDRTNIFRSAMVQEPDIMSETSGRKSEYYLEVIEGINSGAAFTLEKEEIYIGRHFQCELVIQDQEVSRRHIKISKSEEDWFLDDLGSTNGTFVNGQRITRLVLSPGDRIQIGQTVLTLHHQKV
ncbi:MAG: DUF3662 domain-containing protein [Desulfitobacterium hafniense]|nr:DUF3662 domain-containing protein [Desulfitobacterium hafniense]